jgi:CheY-like chemotaxis protein
VLEANENHARSVDLMGVRVLVAEDNEANVRLIERLLGRLGIDTLAVGTGAEAISAVRDGYFDLVLMDLHMPEMDGLEATRILRAGGYNTPIVALTANAQGSDRQACIAAGMNDYLSKPVRAADLEATLCRWLPDAERIEAGNPVVEVGALPARAADVLDERQIAELVALDPDGSAGFMAIMVESYHASLDETMPRIRAAVSGSNWALLEEAAHKLKGVAANIGLARVYEAASELVAGVRGGDASDADRSLADLEAALVPADEALATLLAGLPGHQGASAEDAA